MSRTNEVVSQAEWLVSRRKLLAAEKELTRLRDEVNSQRQKLPWVVVEKEYVFDTPDGPMTLADLFDGRSQLLVQHFMFAPGWKQGCKSCSFMADHTDGMNRHLSHHDVSVVAVSRATVPEIESYRQRMGWSFRWVSSNRNSFNHDFRVSFSQDEIAAGSIDYNFGDWDMVGEEWPGISAFFRDGDRRIFRTYSTYGRGVEVMMGTYAMLDLTAKGRNEVEGMDWVRHHDRYD